MPRGVRDEEFHTAVTELLSDWGSTAPVVATVHIVSPQLDALTVALRDFAYQMGMPAEVVTPESATGREVLARHGDSSVLPVVSALGDVTTQPRSVRDLAVTHLRRPGRHRRRQGRRPGRRRRRARRVWPPRSTASSEGLQTVVLESDAVGGQAGTSSMIRNYLGFPRGISGMRLAQRARNQAIRFGTRFFTGWPVESLVAGTGDEPHRVVTDGGEVRARAVVIATGVAYRRLRRRPDRGAGRPGRALRRRGERGTGDGGPRRLRRRRRQLRRAGRAAPGQVRPVGHPARTTPRRLGHDVRLPDPRDEVRARRSASGSARRSWTAAGTGRLEWVGIRDLNTGEVTRHEAGGLFLLLGAEPKCDWLPTEICLDEHGFVLTGRDVPKDLWSDGLPPANLGHRRPRDLRGRRHQVRVDEAGGRCVGRGRQRRTPGARPPRRRDPRHADLRPAERRHGASESRMRRLGVVCERSGLVVVACSCRVGLVRCLGAVARL